MTITANTARQYVSAARALATARKDFAFLHGTVMRSIMRDMAAADVAKDVVAGLPAELFGAGIVPPFTQRSGKSTPTALKLLADAYVDGSLKGTGLTEFFTVRGGGWAALLTLVKNGNTRSAAAHIRNSEDFTELGARLGVKAYQVQKQQRDGSKDQQDDQADQDQDQDKTPKAAVDPWATALAALQKARKAGAPTPEMVATIQALLA